MSFVVGKVPTALLTASLLGLAPRVLSPDEFGRYVMALALLDVLLGVSTTGLDWVVVRYVPDYRVRDDRRGLVRLLLAAVRTRAAVLALVAASLLAGGAALPHVGIRLPAPLLPVFCALLVVEGVTRILRENVLEALALQGWFRAAMVFRGVTLLVALLVVRGTGAADAWHLLSAEVLAALVSLLAAWTGIWRAVRAMPRATPVGAGPTWRQMRRSGLTNYAADVIESMYSPAFLLVALANVLTPAVIGALGFVFRLVDIIRNYLPGMLLYHVVRARMIGAFVRDRDYADLQRWAQFLFKIGALTLFPVIGCALAFGGDILALASGGHFGALHPEFAALCCWLALRMHRDVLSVVINAVELMRVWIRGALLALLVLPLASSLLVIGGTAIAGSWLAVAVLLGKEVIINAVSVAGMRRHGFGWTIGWRWLGRAGLTTLGLAAVGLLLPFHGVPAALIGSAGLALLCAAVMVCLDVVDMEDRHLVNRSVGRAVFR